MRVFKWLVGCPTHRKIEVRWADSAQNGCVRLVSAVFGRCWPFASTPIATPAAHRLISTRQVPSVERTALRSKQSMGCPYLWLTGWCRHLMRLAGQRKQLIVQMHSILTRPPCRFGRLRGCTLTKTILRIASQTIRKVSANTRRSVEAGNLPGVVPGPLSPS